MDLRKTAKKFEDKLKDIKIVLFDVDGILSTGHLYWSGEEVGFNRFFHTHDGYGLKMLMEAGLEVGIITGGNSLGVSKRFEGLGIKHIYMGNEDKRASFEEVLKKTGLSADQALYMGDEFFDLPILKAVRFSATVSNASHEVQEEVDYVCERGSGNGCVREVIDMLRYAQGIVPNIEGYN
jgi:3-deoxy-D-manno-octulosonate 8-phosphate phosphatase (KDO 8-P phosphatase)